MNPIAKLGIITVEKMDDLLDHEEVEDTFIGLFVIAIVGSGLLLVLSAIY